MKSRHANRRLDADELYTLAVALMTRLQTLLVLAEEPASTERVRQAIDELDEGPWHLVESPDEVLSWMTFGDIEGALQVVLNRLACVSSDHMADQAIVSARWWMRGPLLTGSRPGDF